MDSNNNVNVSPYKDFNVCSNDRRRDIEGG